MPQQQTLEEISEPIVSPLLYTTEKNGQVTQAFVHDTLGDYFLARNLLEKAKKGSLSLTELHNIIGFRGHETADQKYQKTFKFLKDMFGTDYYPDRLRDIIVDPKVRSIAEVKEHYGLGHDSKLIIRIKDDSYCNWKGQLEIARLAEHLHNSYGVQLFCVEGADGYVDTDWFRNFPDEEIRKEVCMYFMKKGEITGIEYLAVTGKDKITIYGAEDKALYLQEHSAVIKNDEDKTDEDHKKEGHAHKERMTILVENTLKAMDEYHQDTAVLVYGGGMLYDVDLSPMIRTGTSYVLLNPKVSGIDWDLYKKIHRNQRTTFEEIINDSAEKSRKREESMTDAEKAAKSRLTLSDISRRIDDLGIPKKGDTDA